MKFCSILLPKTRHPVASCSACRRRQRTHDEQGEGRKRGRCAHSSNNSVSLPSSVGVVPVRWFSSKSLPAPVRRRRAQPHSRTRRRRATNGWGGKPTHNSVNSSRLPISVGIDEVTRVVSIDLRQPPPRRQPNHTCATTAVRVGATGLKKRQGGGEGTHNFFNCTRLPISVGMDPNNEGESLHSELGKCSSSS